MKKFAYIVLGIWFVVIASMVAKNEYTLRYGKEVYLKTVPVDPRDLMRGDYVVLNYEIAQLRSKARYMPNKPLYLVLDVNDDNVASLRYISITKPAENRFFITGKIKPNRPNIIEFGIESYFVPEGEGKKLEEELTDGTLIKVAIDGNGVAKVIGFDK